MRTYIEYSDEDFARMAPRKSKEDIKHLLGLSSTLEILEFFGLNKYPYDSNLNRIANSLSICLYLIKTNIPDKK